MSQLGEQAHLHNHFLDAGYIGFNEDAGIDASVFPPDVKHISEAALMECLQVTSESKPHSRIVEYEYKSLFLDHHIRLFPEVVAIEDSVAQFPEGRTGTADTLLNFYLDGGFLGQFTP